MFDAIEIVVVEFSITPVPMTLEQVLQTLAQDAKKPEPWLVDFFDPTV